MKTWRVGALVAVLVISIGGAMYSLGVGQNRKAVTVGIATWPGFAVGYVSRERGYFEGLDVRFVKLDDASARHAAFTEGDIQIMISSADVFAQEAAAGVDGQIILVTDESFGGDGIVAAPEIDRIGGLKGQRVAFTRGSPSHYFLYRALEPEGMTPQDIVEVAVDEPGVAGQALIAGSVAAAVTWEPLLTEVVERGRGRVLITTRELPGTIVDVLVASPAITADTEMLAAFVRGWLRGVEEIIGNPDDTIGILAEGLGIPVEEAEGMMQGLRLADSDRNRQLLCAEQGKPAVMTIFDEAAELWVREGIIGATPDPTADFVFPMVCEGG